MPDVTCSCGWKGVRLKQHRAYAPTCAARALVLISPDAAVEKVPEPVGADRRHWTDIARTTLGVRIHNMHSNDLMSYAHISNAVDLAAAFVETVLEQWGADEKAVREGVQDLLKAFREPRTVVTQVSAKLGSVKVIERPTLGDPKKAPKHYAFVSLTQVLVQMLQKHAQFRQVCIAESEVWKSGAKLVTPSVLRDVTDGLRFRQSRSARKAGPGEERRLRIALAEWTDEFTVRAQSHPKPACPLQTHARATDST